MNRSAALALALVVAALAGGRGLAHAAGPDAIFDPLTMDHHTPLTTLDVDFAYISYDVPQGVDLTVLSMTIGGQYVTPLGFGGYLSFPLSYLDGKSPPLAPIVPDDSALALGNVELGGMWSKYVSRGEAAVVLHGGLALPTAKKSGIAVLQALASSPRYGDFVQRVPDSSWFRAGVSAMGRSGKLFWRGDLGLDLALNEDGILTYSPVFRINVGGGIDLGTAHLLAELVTDIVDDNSNDEVNSTLALGLRFPSGNLSPGIGVILPVSFNGTIFDPNVAITVSLAARL